MIVGSAPNWKVADEFDRKLFALIDEAQMRAGSYRKPDEKRWAEAHSRLREARTHVRRMMREQDRQNTNG